MSKWIIHNMPKAVINKGFLFSFKKKKTPQVVIQAGNWPCFPLRLLSLSFKRHHSFHPQLFYSQINTVGPWLKIALLALPTWLNSAICQGRCLGFQRYFFLRRIMPKFTGLSKGSSDQHWPHSPEEKSTRHKFHGFPLPLEQGHAQESESSLCCGKDCNFRDKHSTVLAC